MTPMVEAKLALCTCPDEHTAQTLAKILLEQGVAACVNILPGVTSVYRWENEVNVDSEVLMLIKHSSAHWGGLQAAILDNHPYELPEIITVTIDAGLPAYVNWIIGNHA